MGLSLAVLAAILLLLPGAALLFGLERGGPSTKQSPLDAQLSVNLAVAITCALILHVVWLALWRWTLPQFDAPPPDVKQLLMLFVADSKEPKTLLAFDSIEHYPVRIAAYFLGITGIGYLIGLGINKLLAKEGGALWDTLLSPPDAVQFIWVTADTELDGTSYLFAGYLRDFAVNREGKLERLVLGAPVRRPLERKPKSSVEAEDLSNALVNDWTTIPGEFVILQMAHTRTINIDYFYLDDSPEDDNDAHNEQGDLFGEPSDPSANATAGQLPASTPPSS